MTSLPGIPFEVAATLATEPASNALSMSESDFRKYHRELSYFVSREVTVYCQGSPSDSKVYLYRSGRV